MSPFAKRLLSTVVGSILTGLYWIAFFYVAYGLTAGDPRPGEPAAGIGTTVAVYAAGFALYALLAWGWRSIDLAMLGHGRDRR